MRLGIDQSFTNTGLWWEDGFKVIQTKKTDDPLDIYLRAIHIADEIETTCGDLSIREVVIEGLAMGGVPGNSARNLAMLQGLIVDRLLGINVDVKIVAPTSLKKFATGKGNSPKEMLYECCPDEVKAQVDNIPKTKGRMDLVDAYWLYRFEQTKD